MLITNIDWETDDLEYPVPDEDLGLPSEVELDDDTDKEDIADVLSDLYGYLVSSFRIGEEDDE